MLILTSVLYIIFLPVIGIKIPLTVESVFLMSGLILMTIFVLTLSFAASLSIHSEIKRREYVKNIEKISKHFDDKD